MDIMIGELAASAAVTQSLTPAQIGSLLVSQDSDQDLLGGAAAKKEREIIESNRVKLANYIHDVTTLFPLLRQEGIFSRDDVEIIEAPVTTTAKVDKFLDVLLRKGWLSRPHDFRDVRASKRFLSHSERVGKSISYASLAYCETALISNVCKIH